MRFLVRKPALELLPRHRAAMLIPAGRHPAQEVQLSAEVQLPGYQIVCRRTQADKPSVGFGWQVLVTSSGNPTATLALHIWPLISVSLFARLGLVSGLLISTLAGYPWPCPVADIGQASAGSLRISMSVVHARQHAPECGLRPMGEVVWRAWADMGPKKMC